jgi:non-canonical (house-cleaning) NTP pyrophosphatase
LLLLLVIMRDRPELFDLLRDGLQIHVVGGNRFPDKLLGIRDGFARLLSERFGFRVSLAIQLLPAPELPERIPMAEEELWSLTKGKLEAACREAQELHPFVVAVESGLVYRELFGKFAYLVKTVAVVRGLGGEGLGSSGELQLPEILVTDFDSLHSPFPLPGTRRAGGMVHSLTDGLETRRSTAAQATFNALVTLCWGMLPSSIAR